MFEYSIKVSARASPILKTTWKLAAVVNSLAKIKMQGCRFMLAFMKMIVALLSLRGRPQKWTVPAVLFLMKTKRVHFEDVDVYFRERLVFKVKIERSKILVYLKKVNFLSTYLH